MLLLRAPAAPELLPGAACCAAQNEDAVMAVLLASTGLSVSCLRMMHRGSLEYGGLSEDRL